MTLCALCHRIHACLKLRRVTIPLLLSPRCHTSWDDAWWWAPWKPRSSCCWPCAPAVCLPGGGCWRSAHWCSGSGLQDTNKQARTQQMNRYLLRWNKIKQLQLVTLERLNHEELVDAAWMYADISSGAFIWLDRYQRTRQWTNDYLMIEGWIGTWATATLNPFCAGDSAAQHTYFTRMSIKYQLQKMESYIRKSMPLQHNQLRWCTTPANTQMNGLMMNNEPEFSRRSPWLLAMEQKWLDLSFDTGWRASGV